MTLFELRNKFNSILAPVYPKSEIESIFNLVLQDLFGIDKASLILNGNKAFLESEKVLRVLNRLENKEPVQHIIEKTTCYGLAFKVNSKVLIPRPETEELIDWIIKDTKAKNKAKKITILDIGTGSGCIAISLAKNIPNAEVWALDLSKEGLLVAKENAKMNKVAIQFMQKDILSTKTLAHSFDILVSNPPYVRSKEKEFIHENVKKFEPELALFVTDDNPLIFYDKISKLAFNYLNTEGTLYFEINQYLAKETVMLLKSNGFTEISLRKDFLNNDRMIKAKL